MDLGLPTGGVAQLIGAMEEANALMLNALLNSKLDKGGAMPMQREHFWDLPLFWNNGITPIAISVPPYHYWEPPPLDGGEPMHGSDYGPFMMAETLGIRKVIYVKDTEGVKNADGIVIQQLNPASVLDDPNLAGPLDLELFRQWEHCRNVNVVQLVGPDDLEGAVYNYLFGTSYTTLLP
jgi:molybdenum storage protein